MLQIGFQNEFNEMFIFVCVLEIWIFLKFQLKKGRFNLIAFFTFGNEAQVLVLRDEVNKWKCS